MLCARRNTVHKWMLVGRLKSIQNSAKVPYNVNYPNEYIERGSYAQCGVVRLPPTAFLFASGPCRATQPPIAADRWPLLKPAKRNWTVPTKLGQ